MQHHVSIKTAEGILPIPDEQIDMFDLISGVVEGIQCEAIENADGGPEVVLPVLNMPMKCYEAVIRYAAYWFGGGSACENRGILINPAEAEIVSHLKTHADFRTFFRAAQYLGNDACIAFASKMLLRNMALQLVACQST
jgi:hypothetical protein